MSKMRVRLSKRRLHQIAKERQWNLLKWLRFHP